MNATAPFLTATPRLVFLDRATLAPQIRIRQPDFAHHWVEHEKSGAQEAAARICEADVVIVNKVRLDAETLSQAKSLKLIAVAATGTDNIDKAYCQERGIAVCNIRGYARNTVPEHVFALLLALSRQIVPYRQDVLDGQWQASGQFCFFTHRINDIAGLRMGIVGKGALGRRVGELARAFGMEVSFAARKNGEPKPDEVAWEEFLATSDVISLHCPLTPETRGLIGLAEFRRMQRRPVLINTARGGIVVEEDLEVALREDLVRGAGIDVTLPEPPPMNSPLMRLAALSNVIVTPHIAWASDEAQQALADQLIGNIEAFARGKARNVVAA